MEPLSVSIGLPDRPRHIRCDYTTRSVVPHAMVRIRADALWPPLGTRLQDAGCDDGQGFDESGDCGGPGAGTTVIARLPAVRRATSTGTRGSAASTTDGPRRSTASSKHT